jgi:glycosyltransferase involved in cell wall biosynthesis
MRTGIAAAQGATIIFIDADGTYPAEAIPRMVRALEEYDVVVASRSLGRQNIPWLNRLGSFLLRSAIRYLYGFKAQDPLTGLYGLHKAHWEKMQLVSIGFGIEAEMAIKAARMGLKILDMPINYRERIGKAKLHPLRDGYRILKTIFAFILLYNPTVTFILPGLLLLALGLVLMGMLFFGPVRLGSITFGVHTMMFTAILALASLQVIIFGVATKLYALAHKFTLPDTMTTLILRPHMGKALVLLGITSTVAGIVMGAKLVLAWADEGFGEFTQTQEAELASFLIIFGIQLLFSVGFLSIFAAEALKQRPK